VGLDPGLTDTVASGDDPLAAVEQWPVGSAAAGVVRITSDGTVVEAARTGDADTVFAWASVTKLLVAMAVLVAVEEGTLALDDPAGPPGSTVRHLLSHASGLGPDSDRPLTAPGRRRIYSNIGYEILADTVSQSSGMPFTDYLGTGVVHPLEMTGTELVPGSSPASGARGPLCDLLVLAGELLAPRLVAPSTLAGATSVAFPGLAGVVPGFGRFDPCDWGLGFEVRDGKDPHWTGRRNSPATFGHFGQSGSFVWVDPEARVACAALCDRDFGPWAKTAWPALADAVLGRFSGAADGNVA
jgi:CubicO group peptidase (beta-lactamase class C family)